MSDFCATFLAVEDFSHDTTIYRDTLRNTAADHYVYSNPPCPDNDFFASPFEAPETDLEHIETTNYTDTFGNITAEHYLTSRRAHSWLSNRFFETFFGTTYEEPEADLEHIEATIYKPYIFPTFLISPNVRVPEIAIGGFDSDIAPVSPHCRVTRNQPDLSRHARGSLKRRHVSHVRLHTAPEGREQLTTCPRFENPSESSQFISPSPRGFPSNAHRTCLFSYHVRDWDILSAVQPISYDSRRQKKTQKNTQTKAKEKKQHPFLNHEVESPSIFLLAAMRD